MNKKTIITALLALVAIAGSGISEGKFGRTRAAKRLKTPFIAGISRKNA